MTFKRQNFIMSLELWDYKKILDGTQFFYVLVLIFCVDNMIHKLESKPYNL